MQLVVVGTAPVRAAAHATAPGVVHFYPDVASLVDGLVAQAASLQLRDEIVVVSPEPMAPAVRRAVHFSRQALRTDVLSAVSVRASPLRLAVAADRVMVMLAAGQLTASASVAALRELVDTSWSLVRHLAPRRLRDPRPGPGRRLAALLPGSAGCTVFDTPRGLTLHPAAWLPDDEELAAVGSCEVAISDGSGTSDLVPLVGRLTPSRLEELDVDPLWWERWNSARVTELVVMTADLVGVTRRASVALREVGSCFWCGFAEAEGRTCSRCRAQRAGERLTGPEREEPAVAGPVRSTRTLVSDVRRGGR